MATLTGTNLLDSIIDSTGIEPNALIYATLSAKLQQMIDNGTYSKLAASIAISGFSTQINAATEVLDLADTIETNVALIEAAADDAAIDAIDFPDYGGVAPITYTLTASAAQINEGEANTFTVEASRAVEEDTDVTFQLRIDAAGDTAQLEDFNAGAFNPQTVTIAAGETTAIFDITAITNDGTEVSEKYTVEATVGGETFAKQVTILDGSIGAGQTFQLTAGLDIIPGMEGSNGNTVTSGDDTVIGTIDATVGATSTLNATDQIDTGEGTDTLRVIGGTEIGGAGTDLPNFSNVEILELSTAGTAKITQDTTSQAGLEQLKVTAAGGDIDLDAADTQDVSVAGAKAAVVVDGGLDVTVTDNTADNNITIGGTTAPAGTIMVTDSKLGTGVLTIDGGTDVTVTASGLTDDGTKDGIIIGGGEVATGDVVVTSTGAAYDDSADSDLNDIAVTGGKTISVTQAATNDDSDAAADKIAQTVNQGAITIVTDATTTDVTVNQDAAVTAVNAADTTGGVTETVSVKFVDIAAGDNVTLGDGTDALNFTASEDMTAAEVAIAFANLSLVAATPTSITGPTTAAGDTQGAATAAKGTFDGSLGSWNSGAADDDTVVFTYGTQNTDPGGLALSSAGTVIAGAGVLTLNILTTGKANDDDAAGGVMGITAGVVDITGEAALETLTVDGFSAAGSQIQGAANDALATVNLSNGGAFDIASAAATIALNLDNVSGEVDVLAGTTTLNAEVTGAATATVSSDTATTLNIAGDGKVVTTLVGLAAATAISTSGFTGTATADIDGDNTTYTGGESVDIVTLSTTAAVTKSVDLGDGDDTLVFGADVTGSTETLSGGDGTDTLSIDTAYGETLDNAAQTFYTDFERLLLNDAAVAEAIGLENIGLNSHVTVTGGADLDLDGLAANAIVVNTADMTSSLTLGVIDDDTNTDDVLNVELTKDGVLSANDLIATEIETVNLTVTDPDDTAISTHTMNFDSAEATTLNIDGNAGLDLTIDANTVKLATINGTDMTGELIAGNANNDVAMTITGGSGADTLTASTGATAKADIIVGGAGNDLITAGSNGASLTGGDGNDIFLLTAADNATGTKEANTYSTIEDFQAGDLLQLQYFLNGGATADVISFAKLQASLNEDTAVFSDFANAAIKEAGAGDAVWFNFGDNAYVVVDSDLDSVGDVFANGADLAIKLAGVDGNDLSYNSDFATVALA